MFAVAWGLGAALVAVAGMHSRQLLRHRSPGRLSLHRARLRHRRPRRIRIHSRHAPRRASRRRDPERDHRLPAPRLQGRLRLRIRIS
jgi:hypothetical protein